MEKQTRVETIAKICDNGEQIGRKEVMWQGSLQPMAVYNVPLRCLIYNKYNGRILSRTKSLEAQGKLLDPETDADKKTIENLLWNSKEDRNKKTRQDLTDHGQREVGIVTKDGIVIDGNRRVMLLNKIDKYEYFKAVVLPIESSVDHMAIQELETSYQMGEDEKLSYNPTEKYLKARDLADKGVENKKIAEWMGEHVREIERYLSVMDLMKDYLQACEYDNVFTQLDGREDHLLNLEKWISNFSKGGSSKAFDGYTDADVDELKDIAFDYIRAKFEGKAFRILGKGHKANHFFGNKDIWESFRDKHREDMKPISREEERPNLDSPDIKATLDNRDKIFQDKALKLLKANCAYHEKQLNDQKHKNKPKKLIISARESVNVARGNKNLKNPSVLKEVKELSEVCQDILRDKSPNKVLEQAFSLLKSVDVTKADVGGRDDLMRVTKDIGRAAYRLEKDIKDLK